LLQQVGVELLDPQMRESRTYVAIQNAVEILEVAARFFVPARISRRSERC
jgi:hypothetical protein